MPASNDESSAIFEELTTGTRNDLVGWRCMDRDRQPRGAIVLLHGLGEHSGRYREFARVLADAGFATLAYDQQGHGRSPGRRGFPRSYESMLEDVDAARKTLRDAVGDLPQWLFGHSLGGNLALTYALGGPHELTGLILSSPMLLPAHPPSRKQIFIAWLAGRLLPFIRIRAPIEAEQLTHDEEELEVIRTDPLRHAEMSLHLATQMLTQGRWGLDHAPELQLPMLVFHGEEDSLTDPAASQALCLRAGERAVYHGLPGMAHETLHEVDREKVFEIVRAWLENNPG